MSRSLKDVAAEVQRCVYAWEHDARIIGNVTAKELRALMAERATLTRERDEARAALALAYPRALQAAAEVVRTLAITRHQDDSPSAHALYRLRADILALTPEDIERITKEHEHG